MKQDLHGPKAGSFKQKETKTKGRVGDKASQNRTPKQIKINKIQNMKSPSSDPSKKKSYSSESQVKSHLKKLNGKPRTEKSKKKNLDSISIKEDKSRKRKRDEEQKKSKSNSSKSAKTAVRKPSSPMDAKPSQKLMKGSKSSKPEQGKKRKPKENGTDQKFKTNNPNSKPEKNTKHHNSFSRHEKARSSRSERQTKMAVQKKPRPNSSATYTEQSRPPNVRRLKIMRALGLAPPVGSPFVSHGTIL